MSKQFLVTTHWLKINYISALFYGFLPISIDVRKERRKCLFNDALNTFYLWLYSIRYIVNVHLDSERGNPLLPLHRLLFVISSKDLLYAPSLRQDSTCHGLCYTSCERLTGMRNASVGPPWGIDPKEWMLYHGATSHFLKCSYVLKLIDGYSNRSTVAKMESKCMVFIILKYFKDTPNTFYIGIRNIFIKKKKITDEDGSQTARHQVDTYTTRLHGHPAYM